MKKLLLSILTLVSVAAYAQKDLSITLLSPTEGFEINSGIAIPVAVSVKNVGSTAILASDSFTVSLGILVSPTSGADLGAFSVGSALNPGDSVILANTNSIGITFSGNIDTALFVVSIAFNDTVANVDPDNSNDFDFTEVKLREFPTGVAEAQDLAGSVSAYPNPASTEFNITMKASDASVEVLDITGKSVETIAVTMGEARMDVSNYKNGVYFYHIRNAAGSVVKSGKFTVSH